jgi:hypothetical protein
MKLVEKARAAKAMDGNTPIIGPLVKRVMELNDVQPVKEVDDDVRRHLQPYLYDGSCEDNNYPNEYGSWMDDYVSSSILAEFNCDLLSSALAEASCLQDLLTLPKCTDSIEPKPSSVPVIFDDQVVDMLAAGSLGCCRSSEDESSGQSKPAASGKKKRRKRGKRKGKGSARGDSQSTSESDGGDAHAHSGAQTRP